MIETNLQIGPLARFLAGGLAFLLLAMATAAPKSHAETINASAESELVNAPARSPHPRDKTFFKRQWGIEVIFVRQTSAGYMLEFRYKVIDSEKALPLFERQTKPILTHVDTGAQMVVPTPAKTGALRNSNLPQEGRIYWMFFANPGKFVEVGDEVAIDIGKFHIDGLIVE
jgi:hypothetical protein